MPTPDPGRPGLRDDRLAKLGHRSLQAGQLLVRPDNRFVSSALSNTSV